MSRGMTVVAQNFVHFILSISQLIGFHMYAMYVGLVAKIRSHFEAVTELFAAYCANREAIACGVQNQDSAAAPFT